MNHIVCCLPFLLAYGTFLAAVNKKQAVMKVKKESHVVAMPGSREKERKQRLLIRRHDHSRCVATR